MYSKHVALHAGFSGEMLLANWAQHFGFEVDFSEVLFYTALMGHHCLAAGNRTRVTTGLEHENKMAVNLLSIFFR